MPSSVQDGKLNAPTTKGGVMKLITRLQSVAWGAGGLAVGLTAWALILGTPSSGSQKPPATQFEQPAAAVATSHTPTPAMTTTAPTIHIVKKEVPRMVQPQDDPVTTDPTPTTDAPTTDAPTTDPADPPGDDVHGPLAPPATPAPKPTDAPDGGQPPTYSPSPPPGSEIG